MKTAAIVGTLCILAFVGRTAALRSKVRLIIYYNPAIKTDGFTQFLTKASEITRNIGKYGFDFEVVSSQVTQTATNWLYNFYFKNMGLKGHDFLLILHNDHVETTSFVNSAFCTKDTNILNIGYYNDDLDKSAKNLVVAMVRSVIGPGYDYEIDCERNQLTVRAAKEFREKLDEIAKKGKWCLLPSACECKDVNVKGGCTPKEQCKCSGTSTGADCEKCLENFSKTVHPSGQCNCFADDFEYNNDLKLKSIANVAHRDACQAECNKQEDCERFSYRKNSKECVLIGVTNLKYPKAGSVIGPKFCPNTYNTSCQESGKALSQKAGGVVIYTDYEKNADVCQRTCQANIGCSWYSYLIATQECNHHSMEKGKGMNYKKRVVSGPKQCNQPTTA